MTTDFRTHKDRLATDDAYRARFGLSPVEPSETMRRNGAKALADITAIAPPDPLLAAAGALIDQADAALQAREQHPAVAGDTIDPDLFIRVDQLDRLRLELDRLSKELKAAVEEDQEVLVDEYRRVGTGLFELGGRVGTLGSQIWARKIAEDITGTDVVDALRADGLAHLVKPESYHGGQLSAYVRRLEEEGQPIPPHLAEVIEAYEVWRVGYTTRRATRAQRRRDGVPSSVLDGASEG